MTSRIFSYANTLFREGRYDEAIAAYQKAIDTRRNFYLYYENLAVALDKVGKFGEANSARQRARELRPPELIDQVVTDAAAEGRMSQPAYVPRSCTAVRAEGWERDPAVKPMLNTRPRNEGKLKKNYYASPLSECPDTFLLCRIIGNDLIPRHAKGQSRENLEFALKNEPMFDDCQRLWIVNRIVDESEKAAIIQILEAYGQEYIDIPFVTEDYREIGLDYDVLPYPGYLESEEFEKLGEGPKRRVQIALYRLKNLYIMNNNGARNVALRVGRERAKWVLPWDGNCFLTERAWNEIRESVRARPHLKYFAVPMQRMSDNASLLNDDFAPYPVEEPQIIFRSDAKEEFNEAFPYGRRPKVELFWRLQLPGQWDHEKEEWWDQPRGPVSTEARTFGVAGWVARMFSGVKELEQQGDKESYRRRGRVRQDAIIEMIEHVDRVMDVEGRNHRLRGGNEFQKFVDDTVYRNDGSSDGTKSGHGVGDSVQGGQKDLASHIEEMAGREKLPLGGNGARTAAAAGQTAQSTRDHAAVGRTAGQSSDYWRRQALQLLEELEYATGADTKRFGSCRADQSGH